MEPLLQPVADYYSRKVKAHGPTPAGVDWNSAEGQRLRFDTLLKLIDRPFESVSLDDHGCGYGALWDHLAAGAHPPDYLGLDVAEAMIAEARARHPAEQARFVVGAASPRTADFAVASGIFNVRLDAAPADWEMHVLACLDEINTHSRRGFAFNCLSTYSDLSFRKDYLFYGDPCFYFDLCKRRYSPNVALLHDYGLHEFTLLVRKLAP